MTSKEKEKREYVDRIKTTVGCKNCGKKEPSERLHFHHIDDETKIDKIADMVYQSYSLEELKDEVQKCEVLCANCHGSHHSRTKQDCIDGIQEVAEELGKSPSQIEYEEHKKDSHPSSNTIHRKLGSWNEAKETAGLSTVAHDEGNDVYTKQDCTGAIRYVAEKLGKSPTVSEYEEHKKDSHPCRYTIYKKFDSWNDAKEDVGLTTFTSAGKAASPATERQTSFNQFGE